MKRLWTGLFCVGLAACGGSSTSQLPAPVGVAATSNADGSITVSWTAIPNNPRYQVLRGTSAGGESATPIGTTQGTSFVDTSVTANTAFYYKVTATADGVQASPPSAEVLATALAPVQYCETACARILACTGGGGYGYGFGYSSRTYGLYGTYGGYGGYGAGGYGIYGYSPSVTQAVCVAGCHVLDGSAEQTRLITCVFANSTCGGRLSCD